MTALAVLVAAALAQPTAEVQYLQHSGFVVRTAEHVLVFDYVESLPSAAPLPPALRLTVESFDRRPVIVFVSHAHADHLSPVIAAWSQKRPDIHYVLGSPEGLLPGAKVMRPRETWRSGEVVVSATRSTDEGVGFLVSVDGLTLYHAGDLARWSDGDDQAFMDEIRWLKELGKPIDVAFFPIATGTACDPRPAIWEGVRAAASLLTPRVLIPMHVACADRLDSYARFREEIASQLPRTKVVSPSRLGESFRYQAGTMTGTDSAAVALALASGPPSSSAQSDLDAHVAELRRAGRPEAEVAKVRAVGMTQAAAIDLGACAALANGDVVLQVGRQADGSVVWTYLAVRGVPSSASGPSGLRLALEEALSSVWAGYLKKSADADGSGFVSTTEAAQVRRAVELAFAVRQIPEARSMAALAKLVGEPAARLASDLRAYERIRAQAVRDGMVGLPDLPLGLIDAA